MEHILRQSDGKKRCMDSVSRLSKAFALSVPDEANLANSEDVAFF
jgi:type I restriction enzyme R subunit